MAGSGTAPGMADERVDPGAASEVSENAARSDAVPGQPSSGEPVWASDDAAGASGASWEDDSPPADFESPDEPGAQSEARPVGRPLGPPTWKGFSHYALQQVKHNPLLKIALPQMTGTFEALGGAGTLLITCKNDFQANQIKGRPENLALLKRLSEAYFGMSVALVVGAQEGPKLLSQQELRAKAEQTGLFKEARESMGAYIIDVRAKN